MEETNPRTWSLKALITWTSMGYVLVSALTVLFSPRLQAFYPLPEDQGSAWYYWQVEHFSTLGRIAVWTAYALHQLSVWAIFFAARRAKFQKDRALAATGLTPPQGPFKNPGAERANGYTVAMVVVNLFFALLHLVQTQLWYGGLAQDVPIWTSQGSVIVMLVLLAVMEMPRRGLFWGRWTSVAEWLHRILRRWHGVFVSWALVYTFWFHPMEGNWGLMSGFVYMFLLFVQLSIFGTKPHKNRSWVVVLEAFVVVHGTLVSLYKDLEAWPLFFFGFYAMLVVTYIHTWKLKPWAKGLIAASYFAWLVPIYQFVRGWDHWFEILFIPLALLGGAAALAGLGALGEVLGRFLRRRNDTAGAR